MKALFDRFIGSLYINSELSAFYHCKDVVFVQTHPPFEESISFQLDRFLNQTFQKILDPSTSQTPFHSNNYSLYLQMIYLHTILFFSLNGFTQAIRK